VHLLEQIKIVDSYIYKSVQRGVIIIKTIQQKPYNTASQKKVRVTGNLDSNLP
jgi:hypothetical protein